MPSDADPKALRSMFIEPARTVRRRRSATACTRRFFCLRTSAPNRLSVRSGRRCRLVPVADAAVLAAAPAPGRAAVGGNTDAVGMTASTEFGVLDVELYVLAVSMNRAMW